MLMPGLDCSPNGPAWTNCKFLAYFWLFFSRQALGYFGLVLRYHWAGNLKKPGKTDQDALSKKAAGQF